MASDKPLEARHRAGCALLSVSRKEGILELARALVQQGIKILSTGGTARYLRDNQVCITDVSEHTGFPEIMEGRVKTLHPKIHGGLLGRHSDADVMTEHGIEAIDILVLNLYPFEQQIASPNCTLEQAIEQIDIGGPAMLRAAAKNYPRVAVVTDPSQYESVIDELEQHDGTLSLATRFALAVEAFNRVTRYDAAISEYLSSLHPDGTRTQFPGQLSLNYSRAEVLRYGENPHQAAAFYRSAQPEPGLLASHRQLQGKPLSYNNIADADAAWECVRAFEQAACVIVKHANPCGAALADTPREAYERAFACDPQSAFGGIIAFNRELDDDTARRVMGNQFLEVLLASAYSDDALQSLAAKKNVRVLAIPPGEGVERFALKQIGGGLLVQTPDNHRLQASDLKVVSKRQPTESELTDLLFAWQVVKYVKSNAIVFVKDQATLGLGVGQTSRVMSVRLAALKALDAGLDLQGTVMASDAFFPFRDGLDTAFDAGIRAAIHPGGSKRDNEVIAAANEHDMALVVTGIRHFRH